LQYHRSQDIMFLFIYYWHDINKEIRVDIHYDLVKINKRGRLCNINNVFILLNNANKCIIHTLFPLEKIITDSIGYLLSKQNLGVVSK
jgi:hypothetical protein